MAVLGAELEDIADFNAAADLDLGLSAYGADGAGIGLGDIAEALDLQVALDVQAGIVAIDLIGSADHVVGAVQGLVKQHACIAGKVDWADKALDDAMAFLDLGGMDLTADKVA